MSRIVFGTRRLGTFTIVLVSLMAPALSAAQEYPAKPIRWIIPYPTGGTSDFLARLIGQKLTEAWKQPVLVDNRSGANGNIGTELAAKAPPDGYTLLLVASTFTINPAVYPSLAFDTEKDFAPVTTLLWQPYLLSVHPSLPVTTVKQLIELARARPGAIDYGSGGVGNATHIAGERFASMAGVKLNHVPYRGVGPSITALLAGEVQLLYASSVAVQPFIKSGRMKVLAVTGSKRIAQMPAVPTVSESGVPGYVEGNWQAVLVPSKTPRAIINRLSQELTRIVKTPEISAQILQVGADVIASTPDETGALIRNDLKKYSDVVKRLNIKVE